MNFLVKPILIGAFVLSVIFGLIPSGAKTDLQANVFTNATITTAAQSKVIACGQGEGSIGRKTLVSENEAASGVVTITVELRDRFNSPDFTAGYIVQNALAAGAITFTSKTPSTDIAARFCNVSAVSASTSVITVTLRKE